MNTMSMLGSVRRVVGAAFADLLLLASSGCHREAQGVAAPVATEARPATGGIRRTLIGRQPAHEPGWETRLYLIEYPPGAAAPAHVHPAVGVGWVVDGEFESAFGDEPVVRVRAGHGFVDQADVAHRVFRNPSADSELRFVIAYTIRQGEETLRALP
jgi:quercetin dioxygenase-like cupin family protein